MLPAGWVIAKVWKVSGNIVVKKVTENWKVMQTGLFNALCLAERQ